LIRHSSFVIRNSLAGAGLQEPRAITTLLRPMKASRPTKVITNSSDAPATGFAGFLRRQANNILTVLLVIAAIVMLIRWRMRTAEAARQTINNELTNAQTQVARVGDAMFQPQASGPELLKYLNEKENAASASISNVLNSPDADARMRGAAYVARGDMYWDLANLPDLPGSATQPSLQLGESRATYLQKASDAYSEVVKNSTYADQHEALAEAHLGLAAIAENRAHSDSDWEVAKTELKAVIIDSKALSVLVDRAQAELDNIPKLREEQYYVAPPEGTPTSTLARPEEPIKHASTQPTTAPTSGPTTMPSTLPAKVPETLTLVMLVPASRATTPMVK